MSIGIQFDVTATCQSRGKVTVNDPAGITPEKATEISQLNDLIALVEIKPLLTELDNNLAMVARLSTPAAIKIGRAVATAPGETALEKYFNALQVICGDDQCAALPADDRPYALTRLNYLQTAAWKSFGKPILSREGLGRLIEAEAARGEAGVKKTLRAVEFLIATMAEELKVPQDELSQNKLEQLIAERCNAGVKVAPPPVTNSPTDAKPPAAAPARKGKVAVEYGVSVLPAYGLLVAGKENASVEAGPALHDRAALALNFPGVAKTLQLDYSGLVNVSAGFKARFSQDQATLSLLLDFKKLDLITQAGYLWLNDRLNNQSEHIGSLGLGTVMLGRLLYLFGGGLAGTTFGGYGGIRSSYTWTDKHVGLSGQISYSKLNSSEIAGVVETTYSPVSFWGANLLIGLSAGGVYNVEQQAAAVTFGLLLGLQGDLFAPQPLRLGGF